MLSLLLSATLTAGSESTFKSTGIASMNACQYIDNGWRGTNVPIGNRNSTTEIIHSIAVTRRGSAIGWLVVRRDGQAWYLDGPVRGPKPSPADSIDALKSLGLAKYGHTDVGNGQMIPLERTVDLIRFADQGFEVYSCY